MSNETGLMAAMEKKVPTFIQLAQINGISAEKAEAIVQQELQYVFEASLNNPEIRNCHPSTVEMVIRRAVTNNLSLDPNAGLVYLKTRRKKVSTKDEPERFITVLEATETCNGMLSTARMTGCIIDHKLPVVDFNEAGKVIGATFEYQVPNGRWEVVKFTEYDIERWGNYSEKENQRFDKSKQRNPLYTSWRGGIDPEMMKAKCIKHSLKKLGKNPQERHATKVDYSKPLQLLPAEHAVNEAKIEQEENAENATSAQVLVTTVEVVNVPTADQPSPTEQNDLSTLKMPFE